MFDHHHEYLGKQSPSAISRLPPIVRVSLCLVYLFSQYAVAAGLELSNVPMEVRQNSSSANVMFVFDDSGSMFADYVGKAMLNWRLYWHGDNPLYYDPQKRYNPWPLKPQVPLTCITSSSIVAYPGKECASPGISGNELPGNEIQHDGAVYETTHLNYDFVVTQLTNGNPIYDVNGTRKTFPRSRYYIGYDANGDGQIKPEDGEVYLVVLRYNGGNPQREYYQFLDSNRNGKIDPGELTQVANLPPEVRPKWTDETTGQQYEPTAEQELTNFLQWFVYHRSRMRMAINAMATAIEQLEGANVGIYTINYGSYQGSDSCVLRGKRCIRILPMPVKADADGDGVPDLLNYLYEFNPTEGSTPLLEAYLTVGRYFDTQDSGGGLGRDHPFSSLEQGGACQQSYAVIVTDGEATSRTISLNTDGCTKGVANIADIARCYYQKDLAPNLPNNLPTQNTDMANWQHLITYAVGFGDADGNIPLDKPNDNANSGQCRYSDEPNGPACFLLNPPTASFWTGGNSVDDLWRATIEGHGTYVNASNPDQLARAMSNIAADISVRSNNNAAAAAAVSGSQINDNTRVIIGRFDPQTWSGDLYAYKLGHAADLSTGKVSLNPNVAWSAAEKLRNRSEDRLIFTSDGDGHAVDFTASSINGLNNAGLLTDAQRTMLGYNSASPAASQAFSNFVSWMRGANIAGLRARGEGSNSNVLGDIVHSAPLLLKDPNNSGKGDTVFVGANDGMLHAFDAGDGHERFAYIPSLVHDHLANLSRLDYQHRFYVDGPLVVTPMVFFDDSGKRTIKYLLVSGLGRGGRGYFALDVTKSNSLTHFSDVQSLSLFQWEYPRRSMGADGDGRADTIAPQPVPPLTYEYKVTPPGFVADNDGGKALYVQGSGGGQWLLAYGDDDLGYSYSTPSVVATYRGVTNMANPGRLGKNSWAVLFGNGYGSRNGRAVLYILDANTGELIRKIDTGVGSPGNENGLSSPAALDVDNDGRVDYVYAGDLQGNLWKFDLTSSDPKNWKVAYNEGGVPKPMFSAPGKSITTRPDIIRHDARLGYMVLFGTGRFLGEPDRLTADTQTLFGIWDIDWLDGGGNNQKLDEIKTRQNPKNYLGVWHGTNANSQLRLGGSLLRQTLEAEYCCDPSNTANPKCYANTTTCATPKTKVRITSANRPDADPQAPTPNWWASGQGGIYGWYFDLPGHPNDKNTAAERIIRDVFIRDGKVVATSFIPDTSACSKGGSSFMYTLDARTGARPKTPQWDINGDGKIDYLDLINEFAASGIGFDGLVTVGPNSVVGDKNNDYWVITGDGDGNTPLPPTPPERQGAIIWQEVTR